MAHSLHPVATRSLRLLLTIRRIPSGGPRLGRPSPAPEIFFKEPQSESASRQSLQRGDSDLGSEVWDAIVAWIFDSVLNSVLISGDKVIVHCNMETTTN